MASLSNILMSKSYVPTGGTTVRFTFTVDDATTHLNTKYQIYLDNVLLKENTLTAVPYNGDESIFLSNGGTIKITLTDSNSVATNWTYVMNSETRDTFTIDRRMEYDTSTILNGTKIISGTGIQLDTGTTGEFMTEVPTAGKAKLSTLTITGSTDGSSAINITVSSSATTDLTDYTEYTYPVDKTKYDAINSFSVDTSTNILTMNVNVHSNKTVQVSKDGINFVGYNGTGWDAVTKMTEAAVEALTATEYAKFHTSAYEERLFVKVGFDSNNTATPIMVSKISAVFAANEPPTAQNIALSLASIHNEETALTAKLVDFEGDSIDYRVMIKVPGALDFAQVLPATGWTSVATKTDISHTLNKDFFDIGTNNVKIQMRDQRGVVRDSSILNLQFVNAAPIQASYVCGDFSLQALINDDNNDPLAYRVFINGVQKFPTTGYTTFTAAPRVIDFSWDSSDLKFGLSNEIKLEVIDEFDGKLTLTSNVIGKYKGLLFKDELGNYYSTDKAQILKYIDLGRYIAGSITTPKVVILENHTGAPIGNIKIKVSSETLYQGIDMSVSPSLTPYAETKELTVPYTLNDMDTFNFYVRVKLDRFVEKTGETLLKLEVE